MDTVHSAELRELMKLIIEEAPKSKILTKARKIKIGLSTSWMELQRVIGLLDGMVNQYAPDSDWQQGFWLPTSPQRVILQATSARPITRLTSLRTRPYRILEVAKGVTIDDTVTTKSIIDQLRAEGDQRPEKNLAVSVGNVLVRHGWERVGTGKYKLVGDSKAKEAKE
jgi:hypothetical protein